MPTPLELRMIHLAARQAGLDENAYRMVLKNAGGVGSAKQLDQAGVEDVMAVFEDSGFRHAGKPADYWRSKVAMRGRVCGDRMSHRIWELAALQKYELGGLCERFSGGRVRGVESLRPREAWNLINALEAIVSRAKGLAEQGTARQPSSVPNAL